MKVITNETMCVIRKIYFKSISISLHLIGKIFLTTVLYAKTAHWSDSFYNWTRIYQFTTISLLVLSHIVQILWLRKNGIARPCIYFFNVTSTYCKHVLNVSVIVESMNKIIILQFKKALFLVFDKYNIYSCRFITELNEVVE
jgi:hypothetical protein